MNIFTVSISMIVKYWAVTNMWLIANHGCSQKLLGSRFLLFHFK